MSFLDSAGSYELLAAVKFIHFPFLLCGKFTMKAAVSHIKSLSLAVALCLSLSVPAFAGAKPDHDIVILHTNDVHCGIDKNIGYAGFSLYKKQMLNKTPYVATVDAGDAVQGEPICSMTSGEYPIKIMNKVGYDFIVPGNHEFDFGMGTFLKLNSLSAVPYHAANLTDLRTGKRVFEGYKIISYGNVKVAFVGATTPESLTSSSPTSFQDQDGRQIYSFGEDQTGEGFYSLVQKSVDEARAAGADYVILVGHVGEEGTLPIWNAQSLVAHCSGIDAFIDGHSHEVTPGITYKDKDGRAVLVNQAATKFKYFGKITINTEGELKAELIDKVNVSTEQVDYTVRSGDTLIKIARHEMGNPKLWRQLASDNSRVISDPSKIRPGMKLKLNKTLGVVNADGKSVDPDVDRLVNSLTEEFEGIFNQKVAHTDKMMRVKDDNEEWIVRSQETGLGDLIADAYRESTESEIGFIHGSGVRDNLPAGDVTYRDLINVQPFGNWISKIEIRGSTLMEVLEKSLFKYPEAGQYPQLSGVTLTFDPSVPTPVRVDGKGNFIKLEGAPRVTDVKVNGEPLDPDRTYTMAVCEFHAGLYGDGFTMYKDANILQRHYASDSDILIEYFKKHKPINPKFYEEYGLGNITVKK